VATRTVAFFIFRRKDVFMDNLQIQKSPPDTPTEKKPKKRKRAFQTLAVALAALLALSMLTSLFGQPTEAFAGTTGGDSATYQLYDDTGSSAYTRIGLLRVDGNAAYCVEFHSEFSAGIYVERLDAAAVYGQAFVTKIALYQDYLNSVSWLSDTQRYFIAQAMVWEDLEGGFLGGLRVDMGVSSQNQINLKAEARAYYNTYKNSYVGRGYYWNAGARQDLAEFWVERHTLGSINLKKESADPTATTGNSRYSLAGAIYTIYNSSNTAVGTLTIDANGDSNTVSNLWAGEFGTYYVRETKAPQGYERNTTTYTVHLTNDNQIITVRAKDEPVLGSIELTKSSANPSISDGNECYRLNGARYGIYRSEADARAGANRYREIVTNNAGYGTAEGLPLGEYWVREYQAPEGYAKDASVYYVDITTARTKVTVSSKDQPKNDPIAILLSKADADTGLAYAGSEAASLEGAEFTVRFYSSQIATAAEAQSTAPTRSWVFRTDTEGYCLLDDDYLVSGDALYKSSAGYATIPLGTFTILETKAPQGYLLSTPTLPNATRIFHITDDGTDGEFLYVYNVPEFREQIVRGDVEIVKYQENEVTTPDLPSELKDPEVGVTFDLYASRDFTGTSPKTGATPALSLVTDTDGVASTIGTGKVLLQWPDGTYSVRPRTPQDSGALPYDSYLVVQRDAPYGYSPANRFAITVSADKACRTYIVGNTLTASAIRVEKQDSETGAAVGYPAKWQILDAQTGTPISMTVRYPKTQVLDTFTSDAQGWLLLPEMLPMGHYLLHEVEAPSDGGIGYLINPVDVPFEVSARHDWDDPLVIACMDAPAKGRIELYKSDELSDRPVAGAVYEVIAAKDIYTLEGTLRAAKGETVATLLTDEDGYATTGELYMGSYYIQETVTPDGFALSPERYAVDLTYQGQEATTYAESIEATDEPTTLGLLKLDAGTGEPLSGVTFAIEDSEGNVTEITSSEDGRCAYPYLPRGSYTVYEVATVPGYLLSDEIVEVAVDESGLIEGEAHYELIFTNDFTKLSISKTDIVTGEPVIGATLQILPVDAEEPLYEWITTDDDYFIERIPQGDYILREVTAPAGYVVTQDVLFTVENTSEIQRVEMQDDFTRVAISKTDIVTGEPVIGATLQILPVDADGNISEEPLYEWTTTEDDYLIERIPQGDYILREVAAPAGYVVAKDVPFTVESATEIQRVEMQDDFTRVEIIKLNATTQKPLAGATLQVIDAEGNVIFEWVSTEEPFLIERIPQGEYTLHEVAAPEGFELAEDIGFTVADAADTLTVTMADEATPEPEVPDEPLDKTGRDGSLPFAAVGILALLALGGALFAVRHLRKRSGAGTSTDSADTPDEGEGE
jgi:uncharacterized surface anchored protein